VSLASLDGGEVDHVGNTILVAKAGRECGACANHLVALASLRDEGGNGVDCVDDSFHGGCVSDVKVRNKNVSETKKFQVG
jgi:hypothetical protein